MSVETLLNIAWVVLLSLLGLALPLGIGIMVPGSAGSGESWARGRLLLAGLLAVLLSLAGGFSLQYGAVHVLQLGERPLLSWQWSPFGPGSGLLAWAGPGVGVEAGRLALFLLQALGATTVVVLALAPLSSRLPGPGWVAMAVFIAAGFYPLLGHWVWGGGWLSAVGETAYLGHGYADWGGAGVHYALGGLLALAGLWASGTRRETPLEESGPPLGGSFLALLGITALQLAAAREVVPQLGLVAVNTWVSAAAAGLVATVYMAFTTTRFRPAMLARGLLGGAVASAGLGPLAPPMTLLLVGAVAGLLVCLGSYLVGRVWRLEDPAGIVPTFGLSGLWGLLALGLFASGAFGQGLNGIGAGRYLGVAGQGVAGIALLAPEMVPDYTQLAAQGLGCLVILLWALGPGWLLFRLASLEPRKEESAGGRE